nr:zeatin O-glucosyltransferase-like [Ipomoea batatas]
MAEGVAEEQGGVERRQDLRGVPGFGVGGGGFERRRWEFVEMKVGNGERIPSLDSVLGLADMKGGAGVIYGYSKTKSLKMGEQSSQNGGIGAEVVVVMVPLPAQGHLNQLLHLSRLISSYNIPVYYTGAATHLRQVSVMDGGKHTFKLISPSKIPELKMAGGIGHGGGPGVEVAVVMVPLPAQGHLNQLLHLSRLLSSYNIPVYYTGAATHIRQAKLRLHGWDPHSLSKLHFHEFPTPSFQSPPPNPDIRYPTQLLPAFHAALLLRDPLREFLSDLSKETRRVVVIYDNMMSWNVQDIPSIPNAECYAFNSVSAFSIYSFIWEIMQKPPLPPEAQVLKDLPNLEACMAPEFWEFNKIQQQALRFDSGILYNTCRAIEGAFLDLVAKEPIIGTGQQWAIGPFNPVTLPENQDSGVRHKCLAWLDNQERNSVIFVSFGSTTALSEEQINEIAIGEADKGDVFVGEARRAELPEGYEEGIKGKGMVVKDWAPQLEILAHPSTGGFMSHCGWNSCMEGISMGVPIAAWPMHSDQPRNAMLITKVLKMGVEVDDCSSGEMVRSQRIADGVKRLMGSSEGDEMRRRAEELSRKVKVSVMDGGAARMEMDSFISHITRE